jgi:glyoxylase-like metal-dependent hydrolase (beta-lactamase superfamily II)
MDTLWGEFLPVPEDKLSIMHDDEVVKLGELSIRARDVPGHANHHLAYLVGDACFTGDIGGIRLSPQKYLRLPMPAPDLHLEKWRTSIMTLQKYAPTRIVPTHFGIYSDAEWHLQAVLDELSAIDAWMHSVFPKEPPLDEIYSQFAEFEYSRAQVYNVEKEVVDAQQIANPSFFSADGIVRYWNKYVKNPQP